jgi:hypothetical protein
MIAGLDFPGRRDIMILQMRHNALQTGGVLCR